MDVSCELVEQVISFRELLEKRLDGEKQVSKLGRASEARDFQRIRGLLLLMASRLEKTKLTAKKLLAHEMTSADATETAPWSVWECGSGIRRYGI